MSAIAIISATSPAGGDRHYVTALIPLRVGNYTAGANQPQRRT